MPFVDLIRIGGVTFALLVVAGLGPAHMLFPRGRRGDWLAAAPVVGICVWVLLLQVPVVTDRGIGVIAGPAAGMLAVWSTVVVTRTWRRREPGGLPLAAGGAAFLALLLAWSPMADRDLAHPIGLNGDTVFYPALASRLADGTLGDPADVPSPVARVMEEVGWGESTGFASFLALVSVCAGVPPERAFSVVTGFLFALIPLAMWCFARRGIGWGDRRAAAAAALAAVHPCWIWLQFDDAARQILSIPVLLLFGASLAPAVRVGGARRLLASAVPVATLVTVYPVAVPFAAAAAVATVPAFRARVRPSRRMKRVLVLGILAAVLSSVNFVRTARVLPDLASLPREMWGGRLLDRDGPEYLPLPLTLGAALPYPDPPADPAPLVGWLALAVVAAVGGVAFRREGGKPARTIGVWGAVLLLALGANRFLLHYPYGYYKSLVYGVIPAIGLAVVPFGRGSRRSGRWIWGICLLIAFGHTLRLHARTYLHLRHEQETFHIVVDAIRHEAPEGPIRLGDRSDTMVLWWSYHLRDRPVRLSVPMTSYVVDAPHPVFDPPERRLAFYDAPFDETCALVPSGAPPPPWCGGVLASKRGYVLWSRREDVVDCIEPGLVRGRTRIEGWGEALPHPAGPVRRLAPGPNGFTFNRGGPSADVAPVALELVYRWNGPDPFPLRLRLGDTEREIGLDPGPGLKRIRIPDVAANGAILVPPSFEGRLPSIAALLLVR